MQGINPLTMKCTYETPCGWCTKWDKKCDMKIPEPPVINQCDYSTNKICQSEEDHQWECCGMSTAGFDYRCKVCGAHKTEPMKNQESVTISTYLNNDYEIRNDVETGFDKCYSCTNQGWDLGRCAECIDNNFKYFKGWENTK